MIQQDKIANGSTEPVVAATTSPARTPDSRPQPSKTQDARAHEPTAQVLGAVIDCIECLVDDRANGKQQAATKIKDARRLLQAFGTSHASAPEQTVSSVRGASDPVSTTATPVASRSADKAKTEDDSKKMVSEGTPVAAAPVAAHARR